MRSRTLGSTLGILLAGTALAGPPDDVPVVQLPVVVDVTGVGGARFTSDLTLVNLGGVGSPLELTFYPADAPEKSVSITTEDDVAAGTRLYVPDVLSYMRSLGAELPEAGSNVVGTLFARLVSLAPGDPAPFAGSRIATPQKAREDGTGEGSFGTFALGVPVGSASEVAASVYGLRENASFRSNLAIAHAGGGQNGPIDVRVTVYDGLTGAPAGEPLSVHLEPRQWTQVSSVLAGFGLENGWARLQLTSGNDRFIAYAVVNDGGREGGGTSDGSWIDTGVTEGTLPIVLSSGKYKTELVLTNDSPLEQTVNLYYTSADALQATKLTSSGRVVMAPRTQIADADAMDFLRKLGLHIPEEGTQGGSLKVTGAAALARVYTPNPDEAVGGTFGLAFPAVPAAKRAHFEASVYGLRQDDGTRSNLALVNASLDVTAQFEISVYSATATTLRHQTTKVLGPGQWFQWNAILELGTIREGYVRVRCLRAAGCDFIVYGVLNDGKDPLAGTSDGSYVPMVNVK